MKSRQSKAGASRSKSFADSKVGYTSKKANGKAGPHRIAKSSSNGSAYRSAKTGRYVTVTAPKIKNAKKRSATVGRATSRLKTAVTVDLPRSRRSK